MTEYAYGTATVSGKFANVKNFILNGIVNMHREGVFPNYHTIQEQIKINEKGFITNNGHECEWLWLKNTNRHFIYLNKPFNVNACKDDDNYSYDFAIEAPWFIDIDRLAELSANYHINLKSDGIESHEGDTITINVFEIKDGEIIENKEYVSPPLYCA